MELTPWLLRDAVNGVGDDVVDEDDATEDAEHEVDESHLAQEIGKNLKMNYGCVSAAENGGVGPSDNFCVNA